MAVTSYSYDKLCDPDRLTLEISQSAIIIALDHIETAESPENTTVFFKDELSAPDEVILDDLVADHVNEPLEDNQARPVTIENQVDINSRPSFGSKTFLYNGVTKKLFARTLGLQYAVSIGSNVLNYTATYPWVKIIGVECVNCSALDTVDFAVYDTPAGTYSGYPNVLLNQFGFTVNLRDGFYERQSRFDADLYVGMIIRMTYVSISNKTIGFNLLMNEVKD